MTTIKINLYSFSELTESAQERAVREQREFLLSTLQPDSIDGITDWSDPEKMEMYRAEFDYIENNDAPVLESIECNDYLFFHNGEICNSVHYTAGSLAGETWAIIGGERYQAEEAAQ